MLAECASHRHPRPNNTFVPKRLVDVGFSPPRLVQGSTLLKSQRGLDQPSSGTLDFPKYTALSYCWGEDGSRTQLKTTKESLAARMSGIFEHDMPAVLRDAVLITRLLSVRYLWIDSLCIMQEEAGVPNPDWEEHCQVMGDIYGNAYVTLLAASSNHCDQSFVDYPRCQYLFHVASERCMSLSPAFCLRFTNCAFTRLAHAFTTVDSFDPHDVDSYFSTLARRGWAYQENRMSTSRLLFAKRDVQFRCIDMHRVKGDSWSVDRSSCSSVGVETKAAQPSTVRVGLTLNYDSWVKNILSEYSRYAKGSFTHPTDLLPALSGIAAIFENQLKDRYLAGHWEKNLFRDLLWTCTRFIGSSSDFLDRCVISNSCRVPSWSCLTRGTVEFDWQCLHSSAPLLSPEFTLEEATIHLAGTNPLGAITGGKLTVRSALLDLASIRLGQTSLRFQDKGRRDLFPQSRTLGHIGEQLVLRLELDFFCETVAEEFEELQHSQLLLVSSLSEQDEEAISPSAKVGGVWGLILCPVHLQPNTFYRIGMFGPPHSNDLDCDLEYGGDLEQTTRPRETPEGSLEQFKMLAEVRTITLL